MNTITESWPAVLRFVTCTLVAVCLAASAPAAAQDATGDQTTAEEAEAATDEEATEDATGEEATGEEAAEDATGEEATEDAAAEEATAEEAPPAADPEPERALPPDDVPAEGTGEPITEHRTAPDYDGLPPPGASTAEALAWIPRILTSPLYLVTEFLLRRPIGALVLFLEQNTGIIGEAIDFFTFADNKIGVFPTVFFDFGFSPSVGIYAFWNEFLFKQNRLAVNAGTFGPRWLNLVVSDTVTFSENDTLTLRFQAIRRPDFIFGDIGSDGDLNPRGRFGASAVRASARWQSNEVWRRSRIGASAEYRSLSFRDEQFFGNPTVGEVRASRNEPLPPAFATGYSAVSARVDGTFDTRDPSTVRPPPGFLARAFFQANAGFGGLQGLEAWFHWGGALAASTDILGDDRVLSLQVDVAFVTNTNTSIVPFTELVDISRDGPMAGFLPGLVRGESLTAVTLSYEWPIWVFLDGRAHISFGNAYGPELSDFDAERLRMSFGIGIEPALPGGDLPFEVMIAFGTETFEQGTQINSFRFVFGTRNGL